MRVLERFFRAAGSTDRLVLAVCVAILVLAATLQPSDAEVTLFGWDVPILCTWRRLTGIPCPGCGLTRSFVYLAHGHVWDAFRMNPFGPFAFGLTAWQIPTRLWREWRRFQAARA